MSVGKKENRLTRWEGITMREGDETNRWLKSFWEQDSNGKGGQSEVWRIGRVTEFGMENRELVTVGSKDGGETSTVPLTTMIMLLAGSCIAWINQHKPVLEARY